MRLNFGVVRASEVALLSTQPLQTADIRMKRILVDAIEAQ